MNELGKGIVSLLLLGGLEMATIAPASALAMDRSWQLSSPAIQQARFHQRRMHGHHWRWSPKWHKPR